MPLIEGKSPWDFVCEWYDVESVHSHLNATDPHRTTKYELEIPPDVRSREFAEWLTHQYRLAMNKGIQIGHRGTP